MTNFEKVKAMSINELAEFIDKQATEPIGDDFCGNYFEYRTPEHGCMFEKTLKIFDCEYSDFEVIKKWLESEVGE